MSGSCRRPFLIAGPAVVSFSGGRTSAMMLKLALEAHGGCLPDEVVPLFCNTGKEHPATLDFVRECAERWKVPVRWLEHDPSGPERRRFREVDHAAASRDGEPYEALIRQRRYLPNPVSRFCTEILKLRVMRDFCLSLGWEEWTNMVGLRADEPRRVARIRQARDRWEVALPLHEAGIAKEDVAEFWDAQPFGLRLPSEDGRTPHGNCDLCFLKSAKTISRLIAEEPGRADWWIRMESIATPSKPSGARFRIDRPGYAALKEAALAQRGFGSGEADALSGCYCHE